MARDVKNIFKRSGTTFAALGIQLVLAIQISGAARSSRENAVAFDSPQETNLVGRLYRVDTDGRITRMVTVPAEEYLERTGPVTWKAKWSLNNILDKAGVHLEGLSAPAKSELNRQQDLTIESSTSFRQTIKNLERLEIQLSEIIAGTGYRRLDKYYLVTETTRLMQMRVTGRRIGNAKIEAELQERIRGNVKFKASEGSFTLEANLDKPLFVSYEAKRLQAQTAFGIGPNAVPSFKLASATETEFKLRNAKTGSLGPSTTPSPERTPSFHPSPSAAPSGTPKIPTIARTECENALSRTPHMKSDAPDPAQAGKEFNIQIYADEQPSDQGEDDVIPVEICPPAPNVNEFHLMVYVLTSSQLQLRGPPNQELVVRRSDPVPDKVNFRVKVIKDNEGPGTITALFFYNGYPCGRVRRTINLGLAEEDQPGSPAALKRRQAGNGFAVPSSKGGPDLTICVLQTDPNHYRCFILAPHSSQPFGAVIPWPIDDRIEQRLNAYYQRLSTSMAPADARNELKAIGSDAFDVSPKLFQDRIRELADKGQLPKHVLIFSEEPHFPWELVVPHWSDKEAIDPLGVTSAVGRWTSYYGYPFRRPARYVPVENAIFWAPDYTGNDKLAKSKDEQDFLTRTLKGSPVDPTTFAGLKNKLSTSKASVLHFICHGSSEGEADGQQTILGLNGESISAGQLAQSSEVEAFCSNRPLVFLSACEVGRAIKTMTAVGGFGPTFIRLNAGAIVAPLWQVFDGPADEVAQEFYKAALKNPKTPLAETMQAIRQHAYKDDLNKQGVSDRAITDGLSTYAAYCFYGDPLAVPVKPPRSK